ncbi:MAG: hypothetical protein JW818_01825 [Pirellulales bacterium]|nr:hypothetical protein [Pirellulales bacterium]
MPRDPNMLAQLAGEYDIGFEKLANAQRYPQCVFQTGIDVISGNDINEAAFQVGRALQLRAHDHLARGEIDRIIDELEIVLRLGRDLCRRTAMFLQTASSGLIRVACEEVVPMVLASSDLTAEHCQRLIALLESIDYSTHWYRRSIDGEYVCARTFLHNLKSDQGPFQLTSTPRREVVGLFNEILRVRNGEHLYQAFKAAPDKRYREEIDELNRWHTSISRTGDGSLQEQIAALKTYDRKGMVSPQIIPHYVRALSLEPVAHAFMRGRARIAGTQCLLALRHWQLTRDQDISSLDEVVRAAGMKETPRDPFGNGSLQMTMLRGHRVIYSVGHDGIDNHGEPEYGEDARTRRGDIVFRLPKPQ